METGGGRDARLPYPQVSSAPRRKFLEVRGTENRVWSDLTRKRLPQRVGVDDFRGHRAGWFQGGREGGSRERTVKSEPGLLPSRGRQATVLVSMSTCSFLRHLVTEGRSWCGQVCRHFPRRVLARTSRARGEMEGAERVVNFPKGLSSEDLRRGLGSPGGQRNIDSGTRHDSSRHGRPL